MKKIICLFLAVMLLMSSSTIATANEGDAASSLYIQALECPVDIMHYATENAARYIMGMDEECLLNLDNVHVGQPFSYGNDVSNLFTFPIFEGEKVVYTFRVAYSPDGELNGTMSTFLVDELNEYMGTTSYEEPLLFRVDGCVLYACVGNTTKEIFEFEDDVPAPSAVNLAEEGEQASLSTYDISTPIAFEPVWMQPRDPSRYINLKLTETQPSNNNWCVAYVTAAILRTLNAASVTARGIMVYFYGGNVSTSQMLSFSNATEYSRICAGLMSTTYSTRALSDSQLMSQLDNIGPVLYDMTNRTDGGKSSHAVALRGYSMGNRTWSIWNPVNPNRYYETFSWDGDYVSTTGNVFYYNGRTIYNFYQ